MEISNEVTLLIQFTIFLNSNSTCKMFEEFKSNNISIIALSLIEDLPKKYVAKLVIDNGQFNYLEKINWAREFFTKNKIQFSETKVIKVSSKYIILDVHFNNITKYLDFNAAYFCNDGSIIYETCCPIKAMKIINSISQQKN